VIVNEGYNVILFCVTSAMKNANVGLVWMRNGTEMTKLVRKELDRQWDSKSYHFSLVHVAKMVYK